MPGWTTVAENNGFSHFSGGRHGLASISLGQVPHESHPLQRLPVCTIAGVMRQPRMPPTPPPRGQEVRFSDDQQQELADALFHAEGALLKAITSEASRADAFDGPRKIMQLGQAVNMLRLTSGQQPFPMHWPGPMGMMMHNVSGPIEIDDEIGIDDENFE